MISPRAVADVHSACLQQNAAPSLLAEATKANPEDELRRLRQENMQLRRDLIDANLRIRELELGQRSTSLFTPSESSEDDFSVEISVTSSTTTEQVSNLASNVPAKVNENEQQIEERDDKEKTISDIIKARGARYHRLTRQSRLHRNPFSHAKPRKMPELRRLFSSESESSSLSSITETSSTAGVSGDIIVDNIPMVRKENSQVSSYAMNYFQRAASVDDSDTAATSDESSGIRFEV